MSILGLKSVIIERISNMTIHINYLLILTFCVYSNFLTAAEKAPSKISPSTSTNGIWVPSKTFVKKNSYCYREYVCLPNSSLRFGRNVKIKGTSLQRTRSVCSGPANACLCNTAPPTLTCKIKFLKRR